MADEAVSFGWTQKVVKNAPDEKKIFGVSTAVVLNNIDCTGEGRVMLQLPFMPGYMPWARMAAAMTGMGSGTWWIPQIGQEVLVAFNHGDVREPYILGGCWNSIDRPPSVAPTDAVTK